MPIREEMRSLTQEIVLSCEDRIAGIAQARDAVKQLRETAKTVLKEFQGSRAAIGKELRADLAQSTADRKAAVNTELKELNRTLKEMSRTRGAMSKQLKADLANGIADRKHDVGAMRRGFDAELKELNRTRGAVSKQLKADLAKSVADHKSDVGAMRRGFDAELKEVRSALAGAHDEWQKMTATMQAKRAMLTVEVKPPEAVALPPFEEVTEEEAVARAEVAEVIPEVAAIQDRVFEYLANHPDGTRLVELEREFGLARIQMARVLKSLMNENKVGKQGSLYFAI
jgi:phenylpyruvate tautomerase PptA (4-oxalocrotonate tautomerase family)